MDRTQREFDFFQTCYFRLLRRYRRDKAKLEEPGVYNYYLILEHESDTHITTGEGDSDSQVPDDELEQLQPQGDITDGMLSS